MCTLLFWVGWQDQQKLWTLIFAVFRRFCRRLLCWFFFSLHKKKTRTELNIIHPLWPTAFSSLMYHATHLLNLALSRLIPFVYACYSFPFLTVNSAHWSICNPRKKLLWKHLNFQKLWKCLFNKEQTAKGQDIKSYPQLTIKHHIIYQ